MPFINSQLRVRSTECQMMNGSIEEIQSLPDDGFTLDPVLVKEVKSFSYEYDFVDGWQHQVEVKMEMIADERLNSWPMCLAGANACPPEDVGGLGGYEEFLEAIGDPLHEEYEACADGVADRLTPKGLTLTQPIVIFVGGF